MKQMILMIFCYRHFGIEESSYLILLKYLTIFQDEQVKTF